jgi:hypothetical protein
MGPINVVVQDANNLVLEVTPTADTSIILDRGIAGPPGPMGDGNVNGPASSTDNAVVRFDGTTGKLIQDSNVTISDAGVVNISSLTASKGVFTDASDNLTSTGTLGIDQGGTGATSLAGASIVTYTGTETLTNKTLNGVILNDGYTEEVFSVTGTTPALSPTNGSIQTWTLTASSTPTAGTWASGQSMTIQIDDGADYAVTWTSLPVTWKTNGGSAPTFNTSGITAIQLWKVGATIYGARVGDA